jgi:hypothetical protein
MLPIARPPSVDSRIFFFFFFCPIIAKRNLPVLQLHRLFRPSIGVIDVVFDLFLFRSLARSLVFLSFVSLPLVPAAAAAATATTVATHFLLPCCQRPFVLRRMCPSSSVCRSSTSLACPLIRISAFPALLFLARFFFPPFFLFSLSPPCSHVRLTYASRPPQCLPHVCKKKKNLTHSMVLSRLADIFLLPSLWLLLLLLSLLPLSASIPIPRLLWRRKQLEKKKNTNRAFSRLYGHHPLDATRRFCMALACGN